MPEVAKAPQKSDVSPFVQKMRKAAKVYTAEADKVTPKTQQTATVGIVALSSAISAGSSLLDSFTAALDTPVVFPIYWNDKVPAEHPLRKMDLFVSLWDAPVWAKFFAMAKPTKSDGAEPTDKEIEDSLEMRYWWVIGVSVCDQAAQKVFNQTEALPQYIKDKYDSPLHRDVMLSIFNSALIAQGLLDATAENKEAKNSDSTTASESSGESQTA